METLINWDTEIFLLLNALHTPALDTFFYIVSQIITWFPLYLLVIFFLFKQYRKKAYMILALFIITIFCTDQTCNLIKNSVERPRPSHNQQLTGRIHLHERADGTFYYGGQFGFPSAHAANSMAFAILVIIFLLRNKKWGITCMLLWSLLLAYSRIYLGVHYPIDIIIGFIVGSCISIFFILFHKKWGKKIFSIEGTSK